LGLRIVVFVLQDTRGAVAPYGQQRRGFGRNVNQERVSITDRSGLAKAAGE
jgi:hypothetical protein